MPTVDGYALAPAVRDDVRSSRLPIIFYTATYQEREGLELAQELGAAVLVKPAEPEQLLDRVDGVLRRTGSVSLP